MTILQGAGVLNSYTIENISGGLFFKTAVPTWRMKEQERERERKKKLSNFGSWPWAASSVLRCACISHLRCVLLQSRLGNLVWRFTPMRILLCCKPGLKVFFFQLAI
jgi:hypothetical protein